MSTQSNSKNSKGDGWFQKQLYSDENNTIFPEEDYQISAMPKRLLIWELEKRLQLRGSRNDFPLRWKHKNVDFSAVTDDTLLHHVRLHLENANNA